MMSDISSNTINAPSIDWSREPDIARLREARSNLSTDPSVGVSELMSLADQGSIMSMIYLGWAFYTGQFVPMDLKKAEDWYQKAFKEHSIEAAYLLGNLYSRQKLYEKAIDFYTFASKSNYCPALYRLGRIYNDGLGVKIDKARAIILWEKADKLGHIYAKRNIAFFYITGGRGIMRIPFGFAKLWFSLLNGIVLLLSKPDSVLIR